jgi:hypothetical protein
LILLLLVRILKPSFADFCHTASAVSQRAGSFSEGSNDRKC